MKRGEGKWAERCREMKRRYLRRVLRHFAGSRVLSANYLGMSREHLNNLIDEHGLEEFVQGGIKRRGPRPAPLARPLTLRAPVQAVAEPRYYFGVQVSK